MEQVYALSEIEKAAQTVIDHLVHDTIIFNAPMGAGKTTLIKALCERLHVKDQVTSPTFSLVNEYAGSSRNILHFDLYRVENQDELYNIGMDDYIARADLKFIEWPELAKNFLEDHHTIEIEIIDQNTRKLIFK
ncbi:MAG: tRNA (adenosine(37)-N6)-threonylcarbamoyltransferase complex ATPase subunit type 1 TsaE [Nonlabens sp.]